MSTSDVDPRIAEVLAEREREVKAERQHRKLGAGGHTITADSLADITDALRAQLGSGRTDNLFRRGGRLVEVLHWDAGTYAPKDDMATTREYTLAYALGSYLDARFELRLPTKDSTRRVSANPAIANALYHQLVTWPNLRPLRGFTTTPTLRSDGTVLSTPGYDDHSKVLYLPAAIVEDIPDEPSAEDLRAGVALVDRLIEGFPFVTDDDRATYLGYLLLPLLREVCPPPYKLLVINAKQPGTGKTLLAQVLMAVHGGMLMGPIPPTEELRKRIFSSLDTAHMVFVFDNLREGFTIYNPTLAALVTSADYTDRRLGVSEVVTRRNDRVWLATGNNIHIGGDLPRRTAMISLDTGRPLPEQRTGFAIRDLPGYCQEHRADILRALLTVVRWWFVQGCPQPSESTGDTYGTTRATVQGILEAAGWSGQFEVPYRAHNPAEDTEDWEEFLWGLRRAYGDGEFTASDVVRGAATSSINGMEDMPELPSTVEGNDTRGTTKKLGELFAARNGRWFGTHRLVRTRKRRNGLPSRWRVDVDES